MTYALILFLVIAFAMWEWKRPKADLEQEVSWLRWFVFFVALSQVFIGVALIDTQIRITQQIDYLNTQIHRK